MCPAETELIRLLSGELSAPRRVAVLAHLQGCAACSDQYQSLLAMWESLGEWELQPPPQEDVVAAVVRDLSRGQQWPWARIAAAVALATGIGLVAGLAAPVSPLQSARQITSDEQVIESLGLDALETGPDILAHVFDDAAAPIPEEPL